MRRTIGKIAPEILSVSDEFKRVKEMIDNERSSGSEDAEILVKSVKEFIGILFIQQYDDIIKILSALSKISPKEMEEKNIGEIMDVVNEILADEAFIHFFPDLSPKVRKPQSAM